MSEKKYTIRAECPACACGSTSHIDPERLRKKFVGNEDEIDVLCPFVVRNTKERSTGKRRRSS